MLTSTVVLYLALTCPLMALKMPLEIPNGEEAEIPTPQMALKMTTPTENDEMAADAQSMLRKACKGKESCWVMWMGDSNMRNTYGWWTTAKLGPKSSVFEKSAQFAQDNWIDQDSFLQYEDGFKIRSSFRFLHGSVYEWEFKMANPHKGSRHMAMDREDEKFSKGWFEGVKVTAPNVSYDEDDAVRPSQYAQMVTAKQSIMDWYRNNPALAKRIAEFELKSPDVVFLTEGWGGLPGCARVDEALALMKKAPQTKFVWMPLYVTNRNQKRYSCYKPKMDDVANTPNNVKFVDNGDWLTKYGETAAQNVGGQARVLHIGVGGTIMQEGCKRLEDAVDTFSN